MELPDLWVRASIHNSCKEPRSPFHHLIKRAMFPLEGWVEFPQPKYVVWRVDYYFRAKNGFGALMLNHVFAYFRKGQLIAIKQVDE